MHTLRLHAVDSRYATDEELDSAGITPDQIPPGRRLMAHQVATVKELRFGDAEIVVNEAMTGDGKTLAGQFQLFNDPGWNTFTMYPTNELIADQHRSLNALIEEWKPPRRPIYEALDAAKLDEWQESLERLSRAKTLKLLLNRNAILTNPDIFHLMMQFAYKDYAHARDTILGEITHRYRLFVFDEFHLFGTPQVASILISMLLILEITGKERPPRFLLLSATPQTHFPFLASKIGLKIEHIQREYMEDAPTEPVGYRRILQPVMIALYPGRLEIWIAEHWNDVILRFFAEHKPGAKGVIIANGVATAHRIFVFLNPLCKQAGIDLGINTGLTPRPDRANDKNDLLVATSTIDVGVDFRINLLIFESNDAASHIQRLGRLGRHTKDRYGNSFNNHFEAHAILPQWVFDGVKTELTGEEPVTRSNYRKIVEGAFTDVEHFDRYIQNWAGVQAANVLTELKKWEIKTQYENSLKRLTQRYKKLFPFGNRLAYQLLQDKRVETFNAASSFRGGSPFTGLIVDMNSKSRDIVPYNLLPILLNGELEEVDMEDMRHYAQSKGNDWKALQRSKPLIAYRLHSWLDKPRSVEIYIDATFNEDQFKIVIEQDGFRITAPGAAGLQRLNRELEIRRLPVLLIPHDDTEIIRRRLRLGYQLELFNFRTRDGITGCAAFAKDALLLDSALYRIRKTNDNPYIL